MALLRSIAALVEDCTAQLRALTFDEALRRLPVVTGLATVLSLGLVAFKVWRTARFADGPAIVAYTLSTGAGLLILSVLLRRLTARGPRGISQDGAVSWMIALELGVLLLVVPVLLATKGMPEDELTGWTWPLLNKRWLLALYNLAIATFIVLPVAIGRCRLGWAPAGERVRRVSEPAIHVVDHGTAWKRWIFAVAGQVVVIAVCWYLSGPPWHLDQHHRSIEWHEQVHFGPLQAISKGYLPAVGPAATAYGPGSLTLTYWLMSRAGAFDLVSFRMAWVAEHFLAVLVFGTIAYWYLGGFAAVAAMILALAYSPLRFFYTLDDGTFTGFFGWASALRYCAPLIVVPAMGAAVMRQWKMPAIVLLGAVWGAGAWLAQDSLTTTGVAAVLLLTLLWLTQTMSFRSGLLILCNLAIGFGCVVGAILLFYAWHGAVRPLLEAYFAFPRAMIAGLANTWWPASEGGRPDRVSYYLTLPFLLVCSVCTLWRLPSLRMVTRLDAGRTRLLAFLCVHLACYQGALVTSDGSHLMSTMIALPFVLVLGFMYLPGWLATPTIGRWPLRAGFAVLAVLVFPALIQATDLSPLIRPAHRFHTRDVGSAPQAVSLDAGFQDRTRPLVGDMTLFLGADIATAQEFHDFVVEIRKLVGGRKTYFVRTDSIAGGLIAFLADLTPAPHPAGGDLLTLNDAVRSRIADDIRAHPEYYEAFVGPSFVGPEAMAFVEKHPGSLTVERKLRATTIYILVAPTRD